MRIIQEVLGHSSSTTTANLYSHVAPEVQRAALGRVNKLLTPAPEAKPSQANREQYPVNSTFRGGEPSEKRHSTPVKQFMAP